MPDDDQTTEAQTSGDAAPSDSAEAAVGTMTPEEMRAAA